MEVKEDTYSYFFRSDWMWKNAPCPESAGVGVQRPFDYIAVISAQHYAEQDLPH